MKKLAKEKKLKNNDLLFSINKEKKPIVILLNKDLVILNINASGAKEFFNKSKNELIDCSFLELLQEKNVDTKMFLNAFKSDEYAFFKLNHGGLKNKYSVTIVIIRQNNNDYYAITMTASDSSFTALKSYVSAVINNLPGAVYWKDRQGRYMGCNKFVAKMAGFESPEEMIGKTDYDLCWQEFADDWRLLDNKVIEEDTTFIREEQVKLANGKIITELTFKTPLKNEYGEIVGIIGTSLDISERKEMEAALHKSQIAAKAANDAKTEFIANMSHDIRTPLSGIIGMSKLLEDKVTTIEERQFANWINESGEQLLKLLNGVLDVVSAEHLTEEEDYQKENFDLYESINDIIQLEKPTLYQKNLLFKLELDKDKVPQFIISDRFKLNRILLNLVGNAIKFTEKGTITITVKCPDPNILEFRVSDTGKGIPKALLPKVFERFYRVTPSYKGDHHGHGVGLHIVEKFIHLLNGNINVESVENKGSTFIFSIPLVVGQKINPIKKQPEENDMLAFNYSPEDENIMHTKLGKKLNLLIVEDNAIALRILESLCIQLNFSHTSASEGEVAFELFKNNKFDIIITDIGLPGISGNELTKRIRIFENQMHLTPIPIIGLTAHALNSAEQESIEAGMNKLFTKPIQLAILQKIVDEFVPCDDIGDNILVGPDLPDTEKELFLLNKYPLLDKENGISNLGSEDILLELLDLMICQEMPQDLEQFKSAYQEKNWKEIEDLAHKMKSGALYCGTTRLKFACQYLERYQKAGHTKFLEKLYQQLIEVINATTFEVKKLLKAS